MRIFWTGFLQHIGGIHSGSAASGVAWFIFIVVRNFQNHATKHTPKAVLAWGVITVAVCALTMLSAAPWIRAHHHKYVLDHDSSSTQTDHRSLGSVFERHHRFAGWTAVAFVWIFVCVTDSTGTDGGFTGSGRRLANAQEFWFALFITIL